MRKLIVLLAVALALCFLAGCGDAGIGSDELKAEKVAVTFHDEVTRGGYKVVPVAELKKWIDEKKPMLIIDTMPKEASYDKNHIPGAIQMLFPIPEQTEMSDEQKAEFEKTLGPDKDRLLVFYCGFTKCTRSHNGAMWATKLGYKNVYRCPGGIVGWKQAGYPAESAK